MFSRQVSPFSPLANSINSKDQLEQFFQDPSKDVLRELFRQHLGESKNLDFKEQWPEWDQVAKTILAFANTDIGLIVVGVKDLTDGSFEPVGLEKLTDKADINTGISKYLPERVMQSVSIFDFDYSSSEYEKITGSKFQVLTVENLEFIRPALATRSGKSIKESRVYVRKEGKNEEASSIDIEDMILSRIAFLRAIPSKKLEDDLRELKVLYDAFPPGDYPTVNAFGLLGNALAPLRPLKHKLYPEESYEEFVLRMIDKKKAKIDGSI
ncbi:MAG: ATP-binding protein [Bacteroidota bacterium]